MKYCVPFRRLPCEATRTAPTCGEKQCAAVNTDVSDTYAPVHCSSQFWFLSNVIINATLGEPPEQASPQAMKRCMFGTIEHGPLSDPPPPPQATTNANKTRTETLFMTDLLSDRTFN